jgi:hypothetical protein
MSDPMFVIVYTDSEGGRRITHSEPYDNLAEALEDAAMEADAARHPVDAYRVHELGAPHPVRHADAATLRTTTPAERQEQ